MELIPHLFRTEYRKIVSVLCKRFGFEQIEAAEDIASDTFVTAAQNWGINGAPPNPVAWLYSVAKNKAKNHLNRETVFNTTVTGGLMAATEHACELELDLSPQNIQDSQLQMMFAICQPSIPPEAQVGLSLRILCGFGIDEIADAFLVNKETINKRLFRAKEQLRAEKVKIEMPAGSQVTERLDAVLTTIYLLFSEGYYPAGKHHVIRKELCLEAMRLCHMLIENKDTDLPHVSALMALMCFHASRLDARIDESGEPVLYNEQDTGLWNAALISKGGYYLNRATAGQRLTKYHLEAAIAYWSTRKTGTPERWQHILRLYDRLLEIAYSPIAALNRTFAFAQVNGNQEAILAAEKLNLTDNHFYFVLLGELYSSTDHLKAKQHLTRALEIAKTSADKQAIRKKIDKL